MIITLSQGQSNCQDAHSKDCIRNQLRSQTMIWSFSFLETNTMVSLVLAKGTCWQKAVTSFSIHSRQSRRFCFFSYRKLFYHFECFKKLNLMSWKAQFRMFSQNKSLLLERGESFLFLKHYQMEGRLLRLLPKSEAIIDTILNSWVYQ